MSNQLQCPECGVQISWEFIQHDPQRAKALHDEIHNQPQTTVKYVELDGVEHKRYQVTCTNTYRVWAANQKDAIEIAESMNDGTYFSDHLGHGKCVDTSTEAEQVSNE